MFEQVSYLAVESIFPEWNNWTQFLDETTSGLRLDALAESHPIEVIFFSTNWCESMLQLVSPLFCVEKFFANRTTATYATNIFIRDMETYYNSKALYITKLASCTRICKY
jgi:hypothetical protein